MQNESMALEILVPFGVFAQHDDVTRMVAETPQGSYGQLPNRRDCFAALAPGILAYTTVQDGERFVAVSEGILVKTGRDVRVSVHRAMAGASIHDLRRAVEQEFSALDDEARRARAALARLESDFIRRMAGLRDDR